jgi:predicted transcriptional regulator
MKAGHTEISGEFLQNEKLSWAAKGLMAVALTSPLENPTLEELSKMSLNGLYSCRTAMNELMDAGYVRRRERKQGGGWTYEYSQEPVFKKNKP